MVNYRRRRQARWSCMGYVEFGLDGEEEKEEMEEERDLKTADPQE